MNILAIPTTHGLFKPEIGAQKRFFNLLKGLEDGNHICILENKDFVDFREENSYCFYYYAEMKLFSRNLAIMRDINLSFILKLLKILKNEKIDLIQVTHPSGIPIIKILSFFLRKNVIITYDAHNLESKFISEIFANNLDYNPIERVFLKMCINFLEKIVCTYCADYITSVSEEERNTLIYKYDLNPKEIVVIPSGGQITDLSIYKNQKVFIKSKLGLKDDDIILFFHGSYSHPANKEAIKIIKNSISKKFLTSENIVFLIGGSEVPKFQNSNVKSIGFIENLNEVLSIVDIAIVPIMKGAGTKLKIFDYMNAALPIITTKKGIEGIEVTNYEDAIILDNLDEFNQAIRYLIHHDDERERIGKNAKKLITEKYDWIKIGNKLKKFYDEIGVK